MLHKPSVERIEANQVQAAQLLIYSFQQLVKECEEMGTDSMTMLVSYIEDDDDFVPGTYVPEICLSVRKIDA